MSGKPTSQAESARGAIDHLKITGGMGIFRQLKLGIHAISRVRVAPRKERKRAEIILHVSLLVKGEHQDRGAH